MGRDRPGAGQPLRSPPEERLEPAHFAQAAPRTGEDGEAPEACVAAVAEPAEGKYFAVRPHAVYAGEGVAETDAYIGQLRPALTLALDQALAR